MSLPSGVNDVSRRVKRPITTIELNARMVRSHGHSCYPRLFLLKEQQPNTTMEYCESLCRNVKKQSRDELRFLVPEPVPKQSKLTSKIKRPRKLAVAGN